MSVHCLRRWPNSTPTLGQRLVFAGRHVYQGFFIGAGDRYLHLWLVTSLATSDYPIPALEITLNAE